MDIKNSVVIITGASSGIGRAVALELAKKGARLALGARREDRLHELNRELAPDGAHLVIKTDVRKRAQVEHLAQKTLEHYGRIDVLINNAGVMPLSFMKNLHVEEWENMIDVNIKGALYGIAAVLPTMRRQGCGHIINISSVAGRMVFPAGAVYCATKFALGAITEGLRRELGAAEGLKFTAIEPGMVTTELTDTITDRDVTAMFGEWKFTALKADDIARAVVYVLEQPEHVAVAEVMVIPSRQPL